MVPVYFFLMTAGVGLVLDARDAEVHLQPPSEPANDYQLWWLNSTGDGTFAIVNKGNGKVLDVERGIRLGANVVTENPNGDPSQRWYVNSDNTIVTSLGNLALTAFDGRIISGNKVIAHERRDSGEQQKFYINTRINDVNKS